MQVSNETLFEVIGRQAVEILLLRQQVAAGQASLAEAVAEGNQLRAELASRPAPEPDPA